MIPDKVREILEREGLSALEFEPGSTPTAQTAARMIGVETGQIAKSLLFRDRTGAFHLVVCAGDAKVHSGDLKRLVGSVASMASHEETLEITGFRPGGVCPFGVRGATIWMDETLWRFDTVYPAAGTDASGVAVSPDRLRDIAGARRCGVCRLPAEECVLPLD